MKIKEGVAGLKQLEVHKLKKNLIIFICCIILLLTMLVPSLAATEDRVTPEENQYFELRAVEVKEVDGQNKQIIMQLWGHEIDFKRI